MARPLLRHGGSKHAAGAEVEVRDRRKKVFFQKMETAFQKNLAERALLPDSFQKRPLQGGMACTLDTEFSRINSKETKREQVH